MNASLVTFGMYLMAFVALIDQGSKWWILHEVMIPPRVVPVTAFLNLVMQWNKGVTFGLLNNGQSGMSYIFIGAAIIILVLLLNWLVHATSMVAGSGISLVMGGALGNLTDRVNHGAVLDFLDFHVFGYHWYAFNIADAAIVCGVGLLLLENLVSEAKKR
jgi:signal peptidase II